MGNIWNDIEWLEEIIATIEIFYISKFWRCNYIGYLQGWLSPRFTIDIKNRNLMTDLKLFDALLFDAAFRLQTEHDIRG